MDTKIKALSAFFVVAVILGSMPLLVSADSNNKWPLGVEIVGTFDEILSAHQTAIDTFITEHKLLMAETQEERLRILEEKTSGLRTTIEEVNEAREDLIAELKNGTISEKEFAAEMRSLATDLASAAESMGELGKTLGDLGKELSGKLRARAEALSDELEAIGTEMAEGGRAVAEEMRGRDLPVPEDLPGKGKPEEVSGEGGEPPNPEEPGEGGEVSEEASEEAEGERPEEVPPGEPPRGPPEGVP